MEVSVISTSRSAEIPAALRSAAEEKIGRLDRFLEGMVHADVRFTEERNPRIANSQICEVTVEGHGHHVRCKAASSDAFGALDVAVGKLEHQLTKLKSKLKARNQGQLSRKPSPPVRPLGVDEEAEAPAEPPGGRIVKTKRFAPMPMTAEDAAQRMDLLGHGFFFFTNIDTSRAAVVYRRDDGDIGLIDEAD